MDKKTKKELAKRGFKVTTVQELLGLSDKEIKVIDEGIKKGLTKEEIFDILLNQEKKYAS